MLAHGQLAAEYVFQTGSFPRRITVSPRKIGDIVKAALVLTHFEYGKIQ